MNIQDILEAQRIPFDRPGHRNVRHGWVGLTCCYCGASNAQLGIRVADGWTTCWVCGFHKLGETLQKLTGATWPQVKSWLSGMDLRREPVVRKTGRLELPKGIGPLLPVHRRYLESRRFDPDEIQRLWHVQGIGLAPALSWRLFIPVELRGETVSWTTRAVGDVPDRYVSAPAEKEAVAAKSILYGADNARHAVVVCEGPTGPWRFGPGAVATLGVGYSQAQLTAISKYPIRAVCFDPEPGAQRRARRLVDDLSVHPGQTVNLLLDSGDPGDAADKEVRFIRKHVLGD